LPSGPGCSISPFIAIFGIASSSTPLRKKRRTPVVNQKALVENVPFGPSGNRDRKAAPTWKAPAPTTGAEAFNDNGVKKRTEIWVRLWNRGDAEGSDPRASLYISAELNPGKNASAYFSIDNLLAESQQWLWKEDGKWFETDRSHIPPLFGPDAYYTNAAVFWMDSNNPPSVSCGGDVANIGLD
jgi:hypothetical protein